MTRLKALSARIPNLAALSVLAAFSLAAELQAEPLRFERLDWRDLHFRASKLFITAEAQVSLEKQGGEMQLFLASKVLGRTSETKLWLEPPTARALREERLKIHRDAGLRSYLYAPDHALKVRFHERPVAEARQPLETWTEKSRQRQEFGAAGPEATAVTTPSALLYLLAASHLEKKGDALEATLFADERLVRARATVVAEEPFDGEIEQLGGGTYRPGVALRIQLGGREASGEPVELELLGLEGDLEVLLDRDRRVPLAIRGGMPVLGRIDVKLRAARFR